MHTDCLERQWHRLNNTYLESMSHSRMPPSKFTVVYKELDATHFPTSSGEYLKDVDRSRWRCRPVNYSRPLPPQRKLELRVGLPIARRLGWRLLETYETDRRDGANFHATQAKVPSRVRPVDCLHWMLPGIPDVWTEELLRVMSD